jgi:osmoprotectant transport system permease protein
MEFITFFLKNYSKLFTMLGQHLVLAFVSLGVSVLFALPVGYLIFRKKAASNGIIGVFSVIYSIPSLALFTVMLPITGIGPQTAIIVISIYAQFIMLRSTITGFQSVDPSIMEVSRGMGLNRWEILSTVQLPLAAPVLLSGLRLAGLASIGIATIGATINSGGLGTILFEGIRNIHAVKIIWGVIFTSALSFCANHLISKAEIYCSKRARGEPAGKHKKIPKNIYDTSL